jgi:hypothetical protein
VRCHGVLVLSEVWVNVRGVGLHCRGGWDNWQVRVAVMVVVVVLRHEDVRRVWHQRDGGRMRLRGIQRLRVLLVGERVRRRQADGNVKRRRTGQARRAGRPGRPGGGGWQ